MSITEEIREPDWDLRAYLENNEDIYTREDIANVHATVAGHNEEYDWYWILTLKDGRIVLTTAGCDLTGWDCSSSGSSEIAESLEVAAMLAPENDHGRAIQRNLLAQIRGEQPFGLEIWDTATKEPQS